MLDEKRKAAEEQEQGITEPDIQLSLFKRASTKGSQAEITTAGKPGADGPPQIQETRETESSSRGAQTTASSRSHSATCNLLSHLVYNIF